MKNPEERRMRGKEEERAGDAVKVIAEQAEQAEQSSERVNIWMFHNPRDAGVPTTGYLREFPITSVDACLGHGYALCSPCLSGRKHRPWTVVTRESGMEETNWPRHVRSLSYPYKGFCWHILHFFF